MSNFWKYTLLFGVLLVFGLFFAQKIHFVTADLGRHIKNGEMFCKNHKIITTNFYSYTETNYPTITHHWGSGVIFYLIHKLTGFGGLSIFYIFLSLATFFLFFRTAVKMSSFSSALLFSVMSIPLIANRTEIRPEGFSYLFIGIYFYILYSFRQQKINFKKLLFIPLIQILWVNIHLFFVFGIFLIFVFLCDCLLNRKLILAKQLGIIIFLSIIACFVNPFGIKGLLVPFTIFKEYGYMLAENQSVLFMQKRFGDVIYLHFEIFCAIFLLGMLFVKKFGGLKNYFVEICLVVVFGTIAWKAVRGLPMFGLFFIPACASGFHSITKNSSASVRKTLDVVSTTLCAIIIVISLFFKNHYYSPFRGQNGIGLMPDVQSSAMFFNQNKIDGPIFNNYDIGGYLIYNLFPQQRVFVDNRPEAYSVSFFKDIYIPSQENDEVFRQVNNRYNFNAIFFYRHDMTPYAQPFLIKRLNDPEWAPVFVDGYTIIFLKRNSKNESLIWLYELPKGMFRAVAS